MSGPLRPDTIDGDNIELRYPTPPGHAEKWQRFNRWQDPHTNEWWESFSVRLTKEPLPGVDHVLAVDTLRSFIMWPENPPALAEDAKIEDSVPVYAYPFETRGLMWPIRRQDEAHKRIVEGKLDVKPEGGPYPLLPDEPMPKPMGLRGTSRMVSDRPDLETGKIVQEVEDL